MKPAHIIAVLIIVGCMVVSLFSLAGAMAPHVGISDAIKRPGQNVQVPGKIDKATVRLSNNGALTFDIIGIDRSGKEIVPEERLTVVYRQPKPENFESATSMEAVGKYVDGVFVADRLLIKCPSKYIGVESEKRAVERADLNNLGLAGVTMATGLAAFAVYAW